MISTEHVLTLDQHLVVLRSVREPYNHRLEAIKKLRETLNTIEAELRGMELKEIEAVLKKEDKVQPFLTSIGSLTSQTENWVIHATVVEKTDIKRWDLSRTSGQLFHVVLEDNSGAIRATIFDSAVEKLYYLFELGKQYAISNGKVRRKSDYSFEMTLTEASVVTSLSSKQQQTAPAVVTSPVPTVQIQSLPETEPEPKSKRPASTPIRSILKIPSVSDEEDLLGPPSSNRSNSVPKSILKNSGDDDNLFHDRISDDTRYRASHDLEETEEEDHGFKVIKKVGFKETEKDLDHPITPKRVGFKEIEDDIMSLPSSRSNQPSSSSGGKPSPRWDDADIMESESTSSTERYSPAPKNKSDRKKKSVSFRTPSDDEEEFIPSTGGKASSMTTQTGTPETDKKTFNLKKYFG